MKCRKRYITLIEIMIVIFIISLVGGVIGYNMKGSLDKGRVFKTKQAKRQLKDILELYVATNDLEIKSVVDNAHEYLENSGLVNKPKEMLKDGWGVPFKISVTNSIIKISSSKYNEFKRKKEKKENPDKS